MSLSIAIVGLPNVGKSTLFNALTDGNVLAANYPFATIEPNTGIVPIPDARLGVLSKMYSAKKTTPATVTFVDIAGLVAGASQGEGLGNQFLSHIRSCSAVCQVVRAFEDSNVQHVDSTISPKNDIDVINTELVLADLQVVQKVLPRIDKEARTNPKLKSQVELLSDVLRLLDDGRPINNDSRVMGHELIYWLQKELQLLTAKPMIYLFNVDEETLSNDEKKARLSTLADPSTAIFVCAKLESELRGLDEDDQTELLASYGQGESGLVQLIHAAYQTLGLQSYLTAGEQEVRAWTIPTGSTAPQAAGVIHTDFERGFIAAQVVNYDDLVVAGSEQAAKAQGKVRTEGKAYLMQPGDIVEFRFNVAK